MKFQVGQMVRVVGGERYVGLQGIVTAAGVGTNGQKYAVKIEHKVQMREDPMFFARELELVEVGQ